MDLTHVSNNELTFRLEKLVRSERKITHLILVHILEVESRRLYADLGYDGMFAYLTKGLGYSESAAYRRLQTARLLKVAPNIIHKIESGELNLSQLTQVQKMLKNSKTPSESQVTINSVLAKIENKNTFETQKILAVEFNTPIQVHESVKPQKDNSVRLELTFTEKQFESLKISKDLLSHVVHDGSLSEVVSYLCEKYNRSTIGKKKVESVSVPCIDANEKQVLTNDRDRDRDKVVVQKKDKVTHRFSEAAPRTGQKRSYLSVKSKRLILQKAEHSCEFVNAETGIRCGSSYQLQMDHVVPFAVGGSSSLDNLRALCRTHNVLMAERWGLGKSMSGT